MDKDLIPIQPTPQVVDEEGNAVEGPEMERILKMTTQIAQTAQLARIRQALERRQTEGKKFSTILNVTPQIQWYDFTKLNPYTELAKLNIFNASKQAQVYIAVNDTHDFSPVFVNAPFDLDYTDAKERIRYIAYYCDQGLTGTMRLVGLY